MRSITGNPVTLSDRLRVDYEEYSMTRALLLGLAALLFLVACGEGEQEAAETTTPVGEIIDDDATMATGIPDQPNQESARTTETQSPELRPDEPAPLHPNPRIAAALTDLTSRLGVEPEAIEIVSAEEVTWSDGSLGCPQPGMLYTQALVPGIQIILEVNGARYHYHADATDEPFFCPEPSSPRSGVPGDA